MESSSLLFVLISPQRVMKALLVSSVVKINKNTGKTPKTAVPTKRFGNVSTKLSKQIKRIDSRERLKDLHRQALRVKNFDEFGEKVERYEICQRLLQ